MRIERSGKICKCTIQFDLHKNVGIEHDAICQERGELGGSALQDVFGESGFGKYGCVKMHGKTGKERLVNLFMSKWKTCLFHTFIAVDEFALCANCHDFLIAFKKCQLLGKATWMGGIHRIMESNIGTFGFLKRPVKADCEAIAFCVGDNLEPAVVLPHLCQDSS